MSPGIVIQCPSHDGNVGFRFARIQCEWFLILYVPARGDDGRELQVAFSSRSPMWGVFRHLLGHNTVKKLHSVVLVKRAGSNKLVVALD